MIKTYNPYMIETILEEIMKKTENKVAYTFRLEKRIINLSKENGVIQIQGKSSTIDEKIYDALEKYVDNPEELLEKIMR